MSLIRFVRKNTLVIVIILFFAIVFVIFTFSLKEGQEVQKGKKQTKAKTTSAAKLIAPGVAFRIVGVDDDTVGGQGGSKPVQVSSSLTEMQIKKNIKKCGSHVCGDISK